MAQEHAEAMQATSLEADLAAVLNRHQQENASGTPDFVLAEFLLSVLAAWNVGIVQRAAWYGEPVNQPGDPASDLGG